MQPDYELLIEGVGDVSERFGNRLKSIVVVDNVGMKADDLTLVVDDRGYLFPLPEYQEKISVSLGFVGALGYMGEFVVNSTTSSIHPKKLSIKASSADMRESKIKEPKTRAWHEITLGSIVQSIAADNELGYKIAGDLAEVAYPHINQSEESDMHLLTRLARKHDVLMKIADRKIIFLNKGEIVAAPVELVAEDFKTCDITNDGDNKYKSVTASYRDLKQAKTKKVIAGSGKPTLQLRESYENEEVAQQAANAKLKALKRSSLSLSATMVGNNRITAGMAFILGEGFKPEYEGTSWVCNPVTHTYNSSGYTMSYSAEQPNS